LGGVTVQNEKGLQNGGGEEGKGGGKRGGGTVEREKHGGATLQACSRKTLTVMTPKLGITSTLKFPVL